MIEPWFIDLLACPVCRSPVGWRGDAVCCENAACGLRYPVREGIPMMVRQETADRGVKGEKTVRQGEGL